MNAISSAAPCHVVRKVDDGWDTRDIVAWTIGDVSGGPIGVILLDGRPTLANPRDWTYVTGPAL